MSPVSSSILLSFQVFHAAMLSTACCVNIQYTRPERDGPVSRGQGRHAKYQKGGLSNLSPCAAATPLSLINTCERLSRTRCLPADAGSDTSRTLATRTSCQSFRDSRIPVLSSGDLKEGLEEGDTPPLSMIPAALVQVCARPDNTTWPWV